MNDIDPFLTEWTNAERALDPVELDALLTDDFLAVGPLGFTLPKPVWVSRKDQGLAYERFDIDEIQTRVHGDAALVTLRQTMKGSHRGQPVPEAARATLALTRDADRWQLAGIHISFIAGTPGAPPMPGASGTTTT